MKVKGLSKEQAVEKLELLRKQVAFNNKLNKFVRSFRKEHNITWDNFNGFHSEPTEEMRNAMMDILTKDSLEDLSWMTTSMKQEYARDVRSIFGQVYSVAVNTYILKDIKDLESYIKTLEQVEQETTQASETTEEDSDLDFKVEFDTDNTRINLFFDYIPSEQQRAILKHRGFKWSRYLGAWTRQLTTDAKHSLELVKKELKELDNQN